MTTSNLVGPETQSFQELLSPQNADTTVLAGATERVSAYSRLKSWLRMPATEAAAAALAFRQAVETLAPADQERVIEAEADALRHGFSFIDFQKLKDYALRALEDPYASIDSEDQSAFYMASMMAMNN